MWGESEEWGQYGSPIPAREQAAQKLATSRGGSQRGCLGPPEGLQSRFRECVTPFLRPWSRCRTFAKCSHIPCISLVSEQLLQGLFSYVDLFFIVPEIHPEAFGTVHRAPAEHPAQAPSTHQPGSLGPGPSQLE